MVPPAEVFQNVAKTPLHQKWKHSQNRAFPSFPQFSRNFPNGLRYESPPPSDDNPESVHRDWCGIPNPNLNFALKIVQCPTFALPPPFNPFFSMLALNLQAGRQVWPPTVQSAANLVFTWLGFSADGPTRSIITALTRWVSSHCRGRSARRCPGLVGGSTGHTIA